MLIAVHHDCITVLRHTDSHPLPAQAYKDTLFCTHTTLPSSHPSNTHFPPHPTSPLLSLPFLPIPLTHTHAALANSCKPHGVLLGHYRNRIKYSVGICNSMVWINSTSNAESNCMRRSRVQFTAINRQYHNHAIRY